MVYESIDEQQAAQQVAQFRTPKVLPKDSPTQYFSQCAQLALKTARECAPTWNGLTGWMSSESLQHILTCCGALRDMDITQHGSCFCQKDIVDSLGGHTALAQLKEVAYDA